MISSISANFFVVGVQEQFLRRRLYHAPRIGDRVVFGGVRYEVVIVEWCLDDDATANGTRLNVEIKGMGDEFNE